MTIHEMLSNVLKGLAPAVGRYPLNERPDTYIAWFEVKATPESASNRWIRVRHMMQVDLYSREPLDTLLAATLYALKRAGCVISDWGARNLRNRNPIQAYSDYPASNNQ